MYEIFTIRPSLQENLYFPFDKEYLVVFQFDRLCIDRFQWSTICVIRDGLNVVGIGYTIQNPHDFTDLNIGQQTAFRRAIESFYNRVMFDHYINLGDKFLKREKKAWRTALRDARMKKDEEMK